MLLPHELGDAAGDAELRSLDLEGAGHEGVDLGGGVLDEGAHVLAVVVVVVVDDGWGRGFELVLGLLAHVAGGVDAVGNFLHTGAPAGCLGLEFSLVGCLYCPCCHAELADGGCNLIVIARSYLNAVLLVALEAPCTNSAID